MNQGRYWIHTKILSNRSDFENTWYKFDRLQNWETDPTIKPFFDTCQRYRHMLTWNQLIQNWLWFVSNSQKVIRGFQWCCVDPKGEVPEKSACVGSKFCSHGKSLLISIHHGLDIEIKTYHYHQMCLVKNIDSFVGEKRTKIWIIFLKPIMFKTNSKVVRYKTVF